MAAIVVQSPRKVHSDVFEVCEDPLAGLTLETKAAAAEPTSSGPPVGTCTPTKSRRAALRPLQGANCGTQLDAAYNDGSCGAEFVPLPDKAVSRPPADAAYNDGSFGLAFEPLRDNVSTNRHADAAYNDGSCGAEFVPLPDKAVSRPPADAAYNDGSFGLAFEPLQG